MSVFSHRGINFFVGADTEDLYAEFSELDNVMSYVKYSAYPGVELYSNGVNYYAYAPDEDVTLPGEELELQADIEEKGWDLEKINTPHPMLYPSKPPEFGQGVFGFPVALFNTTGSEITDYILQIAHTSLLEVSNTFLDEVNDIAKFVVYNGEIKFNIEDLELGSYVGQAMTISYQYSDGPSSFSGLTSSITNQRPSIGIYANMTEYSTTILSFEVVGDIYEIEVHIDNPSYDSDGIRRVNFMAPTNQELRILPLGEGTYIAKEDPDYGVGAILDDTFPDTPNTHGLISWTYLTTESAMSAPAVTNTPVIKFDIPAGGVIKFMIITWKDDHLSLFRNGFYMRLFE
ncbi:MAG: hypothetical protein DRQ78_00030 [Epsilonproteobacteria bacterium]|nr:MAG: hypothetical protein DRQ78_00030 [Campylobacterota bacterium]